MVARVDNEMVSQALLTPRPEVSDSDDVLLALETARALEMQGEFREAARWLRRAAEEAEQQGNDERVLALARAAADLTSVIGSSPPAGDAISMAQSSPPPAGAISMAQSSPPPTSDAIMMTQSSPPPTSDAISMAQSSPPPTSNAITMIPAGGDGVEARGPATSPPAESFQPSIPASASMPATSPPPAWSGVDGARPSDMPLTERSMRIGAIRVAIVQSSIRAGKSFTVERLERGEPPAAGAIEAMLVFTGEHDGAAAEQDFDLLAGSDSVRP